MSAKDKYDCKEIEVQRNYDSPEELCFTVKFGFKIIHGRVIERVDERWYVIFIPLILRSKDNHLEENKAENVYIPDREH